MTEVKISSRFFGVPRLLSDGELDNQIRRAKREIGEDAEIIFAAHALKATGRMARNVISREVGDDVLVTVEAKDPTTGYDYVGVTRFGHRVAWIMPSPTRGVASVLATGRARGTVAGGNAALRYTSKGRVIYAKRTRGFRPPSDWAERALPEVRASARNTVRRLGKNIQERWR